MCIIKIFFGSKIDLDDFRVLCTNAKNGSWFSRKMIDLYFKKSPLTLDELNEMYLYGSQVESLYQQSMLKAKRQLSNEEQDYFMHHMRIDAFSKFPCAMNEQLVDALFQCGEFMKIRSYVKEFPLTTKTEENLLRYCASELRDGIKKPKNPKKSYLSVLTHYLRYGCERKMTDTDNQLLLLGLERPSIMETYAESLNMQHCTAAYFMIRAMIDTRDYYKALRRLLLSSYIEDKGLQQLLKDNYPELKWEMLISLERHFLCLLEIKRKKVYGAIAPTMEEHAVILKYAEKNETDEEFIKENISPLFEQMTPFFCAWVAYRFPELGQKCYQQVMKTAECYA